MTAVPAAPPHWLAETDVEFEQYVRRPTRANAVRLGAGLWRAGHLVNDDEGDGDDGRFTPAYVLAALITTYQPVLSRRQMRRAHRLLRTLLGLPQRGREAATDHAVMHAHP
jgi:hypothetical protein